LLREKIAYVRIVEIDAEPVHLLRPPMNSGEYQEGRYSETSCDGDCARSHNRFTPYLFRTTGQIVARTWCLPSRHALLPYVLCSAATWHAALSGNAYCNATKKISESSLSSFDDCITKNGMTQYKRGPTGMCAGHAIHDGHSATAYDLANAPQT